MRGPDAPSTASRAEWSPRETLVLALLGLVLVAATWGWTLSLPLTGADVWPILAQAGRVAESPLSTLGERYLEGVWDGATFWRPALVGFVALERLAFGETALPYHFVRLLVLLATALVVARSAAWLSSAPRVAGAVALTAYILHPIHVESVPVVARDADGLTALAMCGALLALATLRDAVRAGPRLLLGVLLALLAPAFKEPALLVLPLGILVLAPWDRLGPHCRAARIGSVILAAGLALHVIARWLLLGTLGRYNSTEPETSLSGGVTDLARALFDHQGYGWTAALALVLAGGVLAALGLGATAKGKGPRGPRARLLAAHAAWLLATSSVFVTSLRFRTRYAEAVLVPVVLLAALAVASLFAKAIHDRRPGNVIAALLALGAVSAAFLPGTPLVWSYPQWDVAGRAQALILGAAGEAIDEARLSGALAERRVGRFVVQAKATASEPESPVAISVSPFPFRTARPAGRLEGGLSTAVIIGAHSIEGFVEATGRGPLAGVAQGPAEIGVLARDLPAEPAD